MANCVLLLEYDGSRYNGWQSQHRINGESSSDGNEISNRMPAKHYRPISSVKVGIQDVIQNAVSHLFQERIRIYSPSRTDAGVHAYGMTCQFTIPKSYQIQSHNHIQRLIVKGINSRLPNDIAVIQARMMEIDFDITKTIGKTYCYQICTGGIRPVFGREQMMHVGEELDIERMQNVANLFVGKKLDYASFSVISKQQNKAEFNTFCTLHSIRVEKCSQQSDSSRDSRRTSVSIVICGDRFLHKMVRILVGFLIDIGKGSMDVDQRNLEAIMESRSRKAVKSETAVAHGLTLIKVHYKDELF